MKLTNAACCAVRATEYMITTIYTGTRKHPSTKSTGSTASQLLAGKSGRVITWVARQASIPNLRNCELQRCFLTFFCRFFCVAPLPSRYHPNISHLALKCRARARRGQLFVSVREQLVPAKSCNAYVMSKRRSAKFFLGKFLFFET